MERQARERGISAIEITVMLACLLLVLVVLFGPALQRRTTWSKADLARSMLEQLAHDPKTCHEPLRLDPWGHPYLIRCVPPLPAGCAEPPCIHARGRDGVDGTDDDIRGWEDSRRR